jgi:hypothetical protein
VGVWVSVRLIIDGVMPRMPGRHLSIEGKVCTGHFGREKVESEVGAKRERNEIFTDAARSTRQIRFGDQWLLEYF